MLEIMMITDCDLNVEKIAYKCVSLHFNFRLK